MNAREERDGELLWRRVVDVRNREMAGERSLRGSGATEAKEFADVLDLAGELPEVISSANPVGEADARARLMSLIARDAALRARIPWWRRIRMTPHASRPASRPTLVFAVGLLLLAIAAWAIIYYVNRDMCGTTPSAPNPPRTGSPTPGRGRS